MSSAIDKALFVTEDAKFIVEDKIAHEDAAPNELLIEVHYSGVNPADIRHSTHLGICSTVLGNDFSGRVTKAPPSSEFQQGDIVAGYTPSGVGRPKKYGTHQGHLAVPEDMVFKVPSNLPEPHAAALTVVAMTAADVIHNLFKFPLPTNPTDISSPILIWGASSAVGLSAVQLARAAGCKNIFVTASPTRHELLRTLGATETFDYSSPTVTNDIASAVSALGRGSITHALDAAGTMSNPSSSDLLIQCVSPSAMLVSVVLRQDKRFRLPMATSNTEFIIRPPGTPAPITIPARAAEHWNAWKALHWIVENYGKEFSLPSVNVLQVTAEEALEVLFAVVDGKRGFGKTVLQHPFK
ncbi:hypothetical protein ACJQWK_05845 [Exserohilum turcicum]|uniref:Enoyl reductase (ER) domain-containing protein n=1 Tax=Exserohilum turcicum (strain 28A) TaxID=671987 RepID=R0IVT1_EXST2|nr:uncharacterized protein SETTUDRAFT_38036 [Exserohilum turcica Et28A]EOA88706.1 hypothetical protein SETTUDRAFT_38036 [Exserohilum turcica Et28A]